MTCSCSSSSTDKADDAGAATDAAATDAGARDSSVAPPDAASPGDGGACVDTKSSGNGGPYTCDVFPASASEADKSLACGAFTRVNACPTSGITYRCVDAKSIVAPTVRTERFYYLVQSPAADKATAGDCMSREGTYTKL